MTQFVGIRTNECFPYSSKVHHLEDTWKAFTWFKDSSRNQVLFQHCSSYFVTVQVYWQDDTACTRRMSNRTVRSFEVKRRTRWIMFSGLGKGESLWSCRFEVMVLLYVSTLQGGRVCLKKKVLDLESSYLMAIVLLYMWVKNSNIVQPDETSARRWRHWSAQNKDKGQETISDDFGLFYILWEQRQQQGL